MHFVRCSNQEPKFVCDFCNKIKNFEMYENCWKSGFKKYELNYEFFEKSFLLANFNRIQRGVLNGYYEMNIIRYYVNLHCIKYDKYFVFFFIKTYVIKF